MLPNIVLVGFMGCGKSSVGRRLAWSTGHRFLDTDELVVKAAGLSIPQIFSQRGEAAFRELESAALTELSGVCGIVLSTGGGAILSEDNRILLRKIGVVAWLDADEDVLFERASRSGRRPLLQTENPRARFDALLADRRSLYSDVSDFRIDSTGLTHDEVAARTREQALRHHRRFVG